MTCLNDAFRSSIGATRRALPTAVWESSVDARDRGSWVEAFRSAAAVREPFSVELQAGPGEGQRRWYHLKAVPHGSRKHGYWGTALDITASRRQQERVRDAEDRCRVLADLVEQPAIALDLALCVQAWNAGAARRTGIPSTTAIGRNVEELPPPFGGAALAAACRENVAGTTPTTVTLEGLGGTVSLDIHRYRSGVLLVERIPEAAVAGEQASAVPSYMEHLLQGVLQHTGEIIVVQDPEGTYAYFNAPGSLGIAVEHVAGRKPHEIFPPNLAERIIRNVREVCATGRPAEDEITLEWKGQRHWFHEQLFPLRDTLGAVTAVVTVAHDITDRKLAEQQLREREEQYRSIVEHSLEGIWKLRPRWRLRVDATAEEQAIALERLLEVEECNDAAARIYGLDNRSAMIGTDLARYLHPDLEDRRAFLQLFVEEGYRLTAVEVKSLDGAGHGRYVLHTLVGTVADACLSEVWGTITEITQRRLADREMRLLAQTITCAQDCVSITDLQDRILFVNDAFLRTYGYSDQDELSGRNISMVRVPQDPAVNEAEIRDATIAGGWNGELINRRKDGSVFPVELWTSVVKGEDGSPVALVGVARDITERRRAEEQIRTSLHEKEVMLKEIHHRVKNNLQIVSSLLSLQSEYVVDPAMLGFFRESQNRVKSMALVHEKLYQSSNLASVDFDGYLRELATDLVRSSAMEKSTIELRLDTHPVALSIDKAIPCGIIVNELVTNALKYAFPAGRSGVLYVGCAQEQHDEVRLVIGDSGVGLPADFDVQSAETLGLTLVQMLCEQLQARLLVHRQAKTLGGRSGVEFEIRFEPENGHGRPGGAK